MPTRAEAAMAYPTAPLAPKIYNDKQRKPEMEYLLMQPPFEIKPFKDMTKKEAQSHFDWYVGEIPTRIELLINAYSATSGMGKEDLDYSPESLIKLWHWYINNANIEEKPEEVKSFERAQYPEWIQKDLSNKKISIGWMSIAMDIAIYFSECFIKEYGTVRWGFVSKPKSLAYINKPVLYSRALKFAKSRKLNAHRT
jgi:hypothetical protein